LAWGKYRARYVTEERLASYFDEHRRQFDGTELSVSHILLRPDASGARPTEELVERARRMREKIVSGKLSFEEAAQRHSAGPSGKQGGKLGFIGRRGPMVESFSRAAFALEAGELSEPVTTRFGVHLIRCDDIKPGTKPLAEVSEQVEDAVARELLEKLVQFEKRHTRVELTGKWPYFKPGTRELVVP
jgi:parvulin-like peptidyl-prolyl isomerase